MVLDGANSPVDAAATLEDLIAESIEEVAAIEAFLGLVVRSCAIDSDCPAHDAEDPIGYYMEAAAKLDLVNAEAGGYPRAGYLAVISGLHAEVLWPYLWQGLFELNENDDPSTMLGLTQTRLLGRDLRAADFAEHVNCLDSWTLHPMSDRTTRMEEFTAIQAALGGSVLPPGAGSRQAVRQHLPLLRPF